MTTIEKTGLCGNVSVNALARPLVESLVADAQSLRLSISTDICGATIIDAGINVTGGIEAGRRIALLCMGGLGQIQLTTGEQSSDWTFRVVVSSQDPVIACLGSQYAGWSLSDEQDGKTYQAMASGPARALSRVESLYEHLGYADHHTYGALVLETDKVPPSRLLEKIAADCKIEPKNLTVVLTPTTSLAGQVQIVSRVLEVALHKAHELKFDLSQVVDGLGTAPIPPVSPDFLTAMGRSNDAIMFAGTVQLVVDCDDAAAAQLCEAMPSAKSPDFGKPFAHTFKAADYDFYKIDPMLFAPAVVSVTNIRTGRSFRAGQLEPALLVQSFGGPEAAAG